MAGYYYLTNCTPELCRSLINLPVHSWEAPNASDVLICSELFNYTGINGL